jgi:hypothetical protein
LREARQPGSPFDGARGPRPAWQRESAHDHPVGRPKQMGKG